MKIITEFRNFFAVFTLIAIAIILRVGVELSQAASGFLLFFVGAYYVCGGLWCVFHLGKKFLQKWRDEEDLRRLLHKSHR